MSGGGPGGPSGPAAGGLGIGADGNVTGDMGLSADAQGALGDVGVTGDVGNFGTTSGLTASQALSDNLGQVIGNVAAADPNSLAGQNATASLAALAASQAKSKTDNPTSFLSALSSMLSGDIVGALTEGVQSVSALNAQSTADQAAMDAMAADLGLTSDQAAQFAGTVSKGGTTGISGNASGVDSTDTVGQFDSPIEPSGVVGRGGSVISPQFIQQGLAGLSAPAPAAPPQFQDQSGLWEALIPTLRLQGVTLADILEGNKSPAAQTFNEGKVV